MLTKKQKDILLAELKSKAKKETDELLAELKAKSKEEKDDKKSVVVA